MTEKVRELTHFIAVEKENELKIILILERNFFLIHNLDILYQRALEIRLDKAEHKIPAFLFMNAHREFYLSMCNFLRLHSSNSFRNLRSAIDSVLTAYYLLKQPESTEAYINNLRKDKNKEWNKIFRNIKKTIKNDIENFPLDGNLCEIHEFCSIFSHSDALGILTRYIEDNENMRLEANYFDYEENQDDYKKWLGAILFSFLMIFLVFWNEFFSKAAKKNY